MAGWAEMNASSRSGALAAVAIVAALVGWAVWKAPDRSAPAPGQSETAAEAAPEAAAEAAPEASAEAAPEAAPEASAEAAEAAPEVTAEAAPEAAPEVTSTPPTIDVLRVAPDGTTTLAGRAGPGEVISVMVDGAETATVAADGAGQFATIFTLSPSATARMLSLLARAPDGTVTQGAEEVAIAPMPEPEPQAVAEAAPAADSAAPTGDETAAATEPAGQADAGAEATAAEPATEAAEAPAAEAPAEATPEAPAAIIITDAGAEVLQAPGGAAEAAPAEAVTLQVISYAADGAVQLGGTGAAGAVLRFYLDNAEVASTTVGGDGTWSLTGADIAPGIYTLRIDQLDGAGAVASRIETPFKRETLEALAAAATPAPAATPEAAPAAEPAPEATAAEAPAQPEAPATETAAALPQADAGAATAAGGEAAATPGADAAPQPSAAPITVTVQPGFTLWAIARKNLGRGILYVLVFEANRDQIRDPDLIYPGQVLSLPASP